MGILPHDEILNLHAAVVSAQLVASRSALLLGIDANFVAALPHAASPSDEILEHLNALNEAGTLADGTFPLAVWLKNAVARAGAKKEAAVFRAAHERCGRPTGFAAPANPGTAAPALLSGSGKGMASVASAHEKGALNTALNSTFFEGPGGLPIIPVPHFLGREDELAELRTVLAKNQAVCIVATGLGGIGKTSLVRQFVATEARAMFPGGSVWLDAMSLNADVARVSKRFGFRGEREPTLAEAVSFLAGVLNDNYVLVVIDNVWPNGVDAITLPIVGGKSRTVITSRSLTLYETLGRPAHALMLGRWSGETCRAYLRDVVPALTPTANEDLDPLAAFVAYLPLAVRLLARLLLRRGMTPARLLDKLKREPLDTLDKVATGADRGVAATFKVEYDELATRWRRVVQALAACAPITTELVLARVTGLREAQVGDALEEIADLSLVEHVGSARQMWALHDVVRIFVRGQKKGFKQIEAAHTAFAEQHVKEHQDPLDWKAMEAGMNEVFTAVDRLMAAGEFQRAWQILSLADQHLRRRGRYGELVERYEQLVGRLPDGSEALAIVLGSAGLCHRILGDLPKATERHQRALALHEKLDAPNGQADELCSLGICWRERDLPKAIELLLRSLVLCERLGRREGQAAALHNLGVSYRVQGKLSKAIEHHEGSLKINQELHHPEQEATDLDNLGICYRQQDELSKAIDYHKRALDLHEKLGALGGQAIALHHLGDCYREQSDCAIALSYMNRALTLYRSVGLPDHHPSVRRAIDTLTELANVTSS